MKLHLPKQLFTALLAVLTLAATPAAKGKEVFTNIDFTGDFYAKTYEFSFILNDGAVGGSVVGAYWGSIHGDGYGANALTILSVDSNEDGSYTYTLGLGRGALTDENIDSSTTFTAKSAEEDAITFTGTFESGVVYTISGLDGGSGDKHASASITQMASGSSIGAANEEYYKNNMNGSQSKNNGVNSAYSVAGSSLVWSGSDDSAAIAESSQVDGVDILSNWKTATLTGTASSLANANLIFDATRTVAKEVNLEGSLAVNSISIYGDYTFNATDATTLSITEGLSIASGKTLTLQGDTITLSGPITNNGTLNLEGFTVAADTTASISGTGTTTLSGPITNNGTLNLAGFTVAADTTVSISGTGTTTLSGTHNGSLTLSATSGTVSVAKNSTLSLGAGSHSIGTLTGDGSVTLASNATLTMYMAPNSAQDTPNLGSLALNNNTTLNIDIGNKTFYRIGTATVSGSATIASQNSKNGWEFSIDIDLLTNDKTDSTADTLSIVSNTKTDNRSIVNIVGGDFDGTINLTGSGTRTSRKLALNVKNASVLADTVVQMHGNGSQVALAVGVDSITLKGIADQENANGTMIIVSGAQQYGSGDDFTSDTTFRTLAIATKGEQDKFTSSATVGAYLNLEKSGAGTQAFTGNLSAFNGSIEVTGGTLTLGAKEQSGTMGLGGTIIVSSEAALYLYNSFTNVDLTKLDTEDGVTYSQGDNGYAGATYILVKNEGTTTVGSGVTVNGITLDARSNDTDNVTFTVGTTSGDYYVNNNVNGEAVVYGAGTAIASADTTGIILNGGSLDMQTSLTDAAKANGITAYKNATIKLNGDNVALQQENLTVGTGAAVTLTGSGVYDLGSSTSANVSGLTAATWTGTVKITGAYFDSGDGIPLQNLGNSASSIELSDVTAYQPNALTNDTCNSNIILNNGQQGFGLKITDGWSDNYNNGITFTGAISGNGKLEFVQRNTSSLNQKYVFNGDISKWTGAIEHDEGGANLGVYLVFDGNASVVNTAITGGVGGLNVEAKTDVKFNQNLTSLSSFEVNNGKTATVNATLSAGTVNLGTAATITGKDSGTASMGNVKMNATGISSADTTGATEGRISDAQLTQLQADATFTIQDMTLTNTTITAATTTTQVKLQNVEASDVVLAKGAFTMGETAQVEKGGAGSTGNDFTTSLLSGITLANTDEGAGSTITVDLGDLSCVSGVSAMGPGKYNLSITLSGFIMEDYTQGLLFAADSWLGKLLLAQSANAYVSGAVETPASVSAGGSTGGVSVSYVDGGADVGTIIFINGLNVPEPATATLSLLALAALAARRRRND